MASPFTIIGDDAGSKPVVLYIIKENTMLLPVLFATQINAYVFAFYSGLVTIDYNFHNHASGKGLKSGPISLVRIFIKP